MSAEIESDELQEFYNIIKGHNKADKTIQGYRRGLEKFETWLEEECDNDILEVTTNDVRNYLTWLGDQGYAPGSVRCNYTPVSKFYEHLSQTEIDADPTEYIKISNYVESDSLRQKHSKQKKIFLREEQIKELVENVRGPVVRNRLMVKFMYQTVLRREEVVNVQIDDLNREDREVRVRGKGSKNHLAYWQPSLDGLMTTYLDGPYRKCFSHSNGSPYLFVSNWSEQVSAETLNDIIIEAAEDAGLQETLFIDKKGRKHNKITSHVLRHSFGMNFLQNGGSLEALSKIMAHSKIKTTEVYAEVLNDRAREEYDQYATNLDW